jgi:hypothetical protein
MGQPVVLPKFELAGDKPHWSVRLAWGTGAVLLASVLGLGAVIVHRQGLEKEVQTARAQAVASKAEAVAKMKADADRKVAAAAAAEMATREAELAAKQAARTVTANTVASVAESDDARSAKTPLKASSKRNHLHHGRAGFAARGSAATKPTAAPSDAMVDKSGPKAGGKRSDVIDELLAKMK